MATAKNLFPSVYVIGATCFDKLFIFHVKTGRQMKEFDISLLHFYYLNVFKHINRNLIFHFCIPIN